MRILSATVAPRRFPTKAWNRRLKGEKFVGTSPLPPSRDNGARKTSAPVAIVPTPGTMGCPYSLPVPELISRLNRGPIVIGYSARHRHVCLRKKKWKQRRRFEKRELIDSNFQRIIETFFFRRSRARFLYFRWSGIKAPLKLISCNLYKYRTCGVNA